jgi:hypothetical protein
MLAGRLTGVGALLLLFLLLTLLVHLVAVVASSAPGFAAVMALSRFAVGVEEGRPDSGRGNRREEPRDAAPATNSGERFCEAIEPVGVDAGFPSR